MTPIEGRIAAIRAARINELEQLLAEFEVVAAPDSSSLGPAGVRDGLWIAAGIVQRRIETLKAGSR